MSGLFGRWTLTDPLNRMLDMLEDYMALRQVAYARLDGYVSLLCINYFSNHVRHRPSRGVSRARRALDIRLFQQEKSRELVLCFPEIEWMWRSDLLPHPAYQVFLISTQAGGLGILFLYCFWSKEAEECMCTRYQPDKGLSCHTLWQHMEPTDWLRSNRIQGVLGSCLDLVCRNGSNRDMGQGQST